MNKNINYEWSDFDHDTKKIYNQLISDNWIPDYIAGVKRGGLIPAIRLSHYFNKPMIMMSCQLRDNSNHEVKLLEAEQLPKDKNILIVDDICDSGETFQKIFQVFVDNKFQHVRCCSLFHNKSQIFVPHYKARSLDRKQDTRWILFPWEKV